jgi:acetoin utilization deacetylase AcuC-like enzyme
VAPAALAFEPDLVLISAGFDAHREDPLAGCSLETASFAEMARHVRDLARSLKAPLGAVLEGGYAPTASAHSVHATLAALAGEEPARAVAPEPLLTPLATAQIGRYWPL